MKNISEYDWLVFISYKRNTAVEHWLEKFFYPELEQWLKEELPPHQKPKIFFDKKIPIGNQWPDELQNAIKSSCILIPILNSPYFSSPYCLAELDSMLERQKVLKLSSNEMCSGLIYPIVFGDGKYFRKDISKIQSRCMKKFASTAPAFKKSKKYLDFQNEVKKIAIDICKMLESIPPFDSSWTVLDMTPENIIHPATKMSPPNLNKDQNEK